MQVNVPNVGLVNFPDSMSQDEVVGAIKTKLLPQQPFDQKAQIASLFASLPPVEKNPTLGQTFLGNLKSAVSLSPQQLLQPPASGEGLTGFKNVNNLLDWAWYKGLGMVNPVNILTALAAPEALVAKGPLGTLVNAATRTAFATQGAQGLGQALGQKFSGVPRTREEKIDDASGGGMGLTMAGGSLFRPSFSPEPVSIPSVQRVLDKPHPGQPEYIAYQNDRLKALGVRSTPQAGTPVPLSVNKPAVAPTPEGATATPVPVVSPIAKKGSASNATAPLTSPDHISRFKSNDPTEHFEYSPENLAKYQQLKVNQKRLVDEAKVGTKEVLSPEWVENERALEEVRNRYNGNPPKQLIKFSPEAAHSAIHDNLRPVNKVGLDIELARKSGALSNEQAKQFSQRLSSIIFDLRSRADTLTPNDIQLANERINNVKNEVQNATEQAGQKGQVGQQGQSPQQTLQGLPKQETVQGAPKVKVPGDVSGTVRPASGGDVQVSGGQRLENLQKIKPENRNEWQNQEIARLLKKRQGEAGFFRLGGGVDLSSLGFKGEGGTKFDPQQLMNRIRNVLGDGSGALEYLKSVGLGGFLNAPKTIQQVQEWMKGVEPKVEVRKFGEGGQTTEAREYAQLVHKAETNPELEWQKVGENQEMRVPKANASEQTKNEYNRLKELSAKLDNLPEEPQSHWQSIAPKSEKDMREYAELGLLTDGNKHLFQPHHLPPYFSRGHLEVLPDGTHVWEVHEVQQDVIRKVSDNKYRIIPTIAESDKTDYFNITFNSFNEAAKFVTEKIDPLFPQWERLMVKANIDHANELFDRLGVPKEKRRIGFDDSETAMMTEGHDRATGERWEVRKPDGKVAVFDNEQDANIEAYKYGGKPTLRQPEQAPGMRLHYDRTLPKIAEELTGSKGEKMSFGEHKMAFWDTSRREEGVEYSGHTPRKDLIFRNPDGTPKTDVSARSFSIGQKNPEPKFTVFGRDKGQAGSIIHPATIVQEALDKLDSLKSVGKNIIDSVLDSHAWKTRWLSAQHYDLPKIESLSPSLANSVAKYANAGTASLLRGRANLSKVFGDDAGNEQFRKQLGGIIYEDMRQAEGGIGRNVLDLKNSPFANAQQYQAALKNPDIQAALGRWKKLIQEPAQEMHLKLGGRLAETGETTGAFGNLIAVLEDEPKKESNQPSVGPLATMKKGSSFSKERKFSGEEYNLDAYDMGLRMMTRNAAEYNKRLLYDELEASKLGKLLKQGEDVPTGMETFKNPVTLRSIVVKNPDGSTDVTGVSRRIAVDKRIAPEIRQAFQLDTNWKDWLKLNHPLANDLSQVVIKTQVGLGIDLGFHTFNDIFAVANAPKGWLGLPDKVQQVAKASSDLVANEPKVQEELARMAEAGVTFRGDSLGGWSSKALKLADTVTRLTLNREYEEMVAAKKVVDSPAERRRYINGRAGQYNKRFMTWFQQGMQETGLGSFNVAGRNFNRLAVGNITFSPGVKATSNAEALRLRLTIAAGVATAALIVPAAVNMATTGEAQPTGTSLGDVVISKNKDGTYKVVNMRKWTMLSRAGRVTGLGSVMNEQVLPRLKGEQPSSIGQTLKDAGSSALTAKIQPFSGPPVNLLSTLATGKTDFGIPGIGYEQRTPGEKGPPYFNAALGSLNPLVGPVVGSSGMNAPTALGRVGQRLESVAGVGNSQQPLSTIRQAAMAYKKRNNIYTDEASFAPSEYNPLKSALLQGNIDQAKESYQQLLHEKAQEHPSLSDEDAKHEAEMSMQKEFSRLENFRFVNKENEDQFKASLSPNQKKLYDTAIAQQKQIADAFFSQVQAKEQKKRNQFQLRGPRRMGGMSSY